MAYLPPSEFFKPVSTTFPSPAPSMPLPGPSPVLLPTETISEGVTMLPQFSEKLIPGGIEITDRALAPYGAMYAARPVKPKIIDDIRTYFEMDEGEREKRAALPLQVTLIGTISFVALALLLSPKKGRG